MASKPCCRCHVRFSDDHEHPFKLLRDGWFRDAQRYWQWVYEPGVCFVCQVNYFGGGSTDQQVDHAGVVTVPYRTSVANRRKTESLDYLRRLFGGPNRGQGGFYTRLVTVGGVYTRFITITTPLCSLTSSLLEEKRRHLINKAIRIMRKHWGDRVPYPTKLMNTEIDLIYWDLKIDTTA